MIIINFMQKKNAPYALYVKKIVFNTNDEYS